MCAYRAVQREDPKYPIETVSKVYAEVNRELGEEWYDTEELNIPLGVPTPYKIVKWVGTGKYSDVFIAYKGTRDNLVAVKVLKPVRRQKYIREIKILYNLREGPNILRLQEVVENPETSQLSLITEYVNECYYQDLFENITPEETRCYLYQLLRALDYAHSHGIMHRDVKPLNILFDRTTKNLRLIDWGLGEFYFPGQKYNIHVASLHFKPIELLLDYQLYDYSIDMWSFGVTMAGIVFQRTPFFRGENDFDMVMKIANVLGKEALNAYIQKYDLPIPREMKKMLKKIRPQKTWDKFVTPENRHLATPDALDLIYRCVRLDHTERITAAQALKHPYFDPIRDRYETKAP